jgi:hypothetical protein
MKPKNKGVRASMMQRNNSRNCGLNMQVSIGALLHRLAKLILARASSMEADGAS